MKRKNLYEYHLQLLKEVGIEEIFRRCGFNEPTINKQHISNNLQWFNRNNECIYKLKDLAPYDVSEIYANYGGDMTKVMEVLEGNAEYLWDGFMPEKYPIERVFQISGTKDAMLEGLINEALAEFAEVDQQADKTFYDRGEAIHVELKNGLHVEIRKGEEPVYVEPPHHEVISISFPKLK